MTKIQGSSTSPTATPTLEPAADAPAPARADTTKAPAEPPPGAVDQDCWQKDDSGGFFGFIGEARQRIQQKVDDVKQDVSQSVDDARQLARQAMTLTQDELERHGQELTDAYLQVRDHVDQTIDAARDAAEDLLKTSATIGRAAATATVETVAELGRAVAGGEHIDQTLAEHMRMSFHEKDAVDTLGGAAGPAVLTASTDLDALIAELPPGQVCTQGFDVAVPMTSIKGAGEFNLSKTADNPPELVVDYKLTWEAGVPVGAVGSLGYGREKNVQLKFRLPDDQELAKQALDALRGGATPKALSETFAAQTSSANTVHEATFGVGVDLGLDKLVEKGMSDAPDAIKSALNRFASAASGYEGRWGRAEGVTVGGDGARFETVTHSHDHSFGWKADGGVRIAAEAGVLSKESASRLNAFLHNNDRGIAQTTLLYPEGSDRTAPVGADRETRTVKIVGDATIETSIKTEYRDLALLGKIIPARGYEESAAEVADKIASGHYHEQHILDRIDQYNFQNRPGVDPADLVTITVTVHRVDVEERASVLNPTLTGAASQSATKTPLLHYTRLGDASRDMAAEGLEDLLDYDVRHSDGSAAILGQNERILDRIDTKIR